MVLALALALALLAALQDVEELGKAGKALLDREDYGAALLKYEKAVAAAPDRADFWLGRGRSLAGLKLYEDAENDLSRALGMDPTLTEAAFWRGHVRILRGSHSDALSDFDACEERGYRPPPLYEGKGHALNELGRHVEAEQQITRALEAGHRSRALYQGRAWSRMSQGNLRGAIADETRAIQFDPNQHSNYARRGAAYYGEESWENALRDFRKAAELTGGKDYYVAHWIFLSRCRMGQRDAALLELREFVKNVAGRGASAWEKKVLAFQLGELAETAFLEEAVRHDDRSTAHLCVGTGLLLEGKVPEALEHFQKALPRAGTSYDPEATVAAAEVVRQRKVKLNRIVQDLESKYRSLPPFEATYDLDMNWKPDHESALRRLILTADLRKHEMVLRVLGKDLPKNQEFTLTFLLKDLKVEQWIVREGPGEGYYRADFSWMPGFVAGLERELAQLLPDPAGVATNEVIGAQFKLNLEGKPSKNGDGAISLGVGYGSTTCSWFREALGPGDSFREGEDLVLEFPSRKKTVVIDRRNGLLKSIQTVDYDGLRRGIRLASFKPIDAWPEIRRPQKKAAARFDVGQFKTQMTQQEHLLHYQMSSLMSRWEEVVNAHKEEEVAKLLTRWAARYTDGIHTHVVRTIAGDKIQKLLALGTPPAELLRNAESESRRFVERFSDERKTLEGVLKQQLADLAERTESGLVACLIDNRLHGATRELVRKAMSLEKVDDVRRALYGDRLEQLFREELSARTQL